MIRIRAFTMGRPSLHELLRVGITLFGSVLLLCQYPFSNWSLPLAAATCIIAGVRPIPWALIMSTFACAISIYEKYAMLSYVGDGSPFAPFMLYSEVRFFFLDSLTATASAFLVTVVARKALSRWRVLSRWHVLSPSASVFRVVDVMIVCVALPLISGGLYSVVHMDSQKVRESQLLRRLNSFDAEKLIEIARDDSVDTLYRAKCVLVLSGLGRHFSDAPARKSLLRSMLEDGQISTQLKLATMLSMQTIESTDQGGELRVAGYRQSDVQEMLYFSMLDMIVQQMSINGDC